MASSLSQETNPVHLCGRELGAARHVCAFVRSSDEEYEILAPFIKEGLLQGERIVQILDEDQHAGHVSRLARLGTHAADAIEKEQMGLFDTKAAYLTDGKFDPKATLETLKGLIAHRKEAGFPRMRVTGAMAWALDGYPGSERLLEYETRVNLVAEGNEDVYVCVYDIDKFPSSALIDIMRTHPAVIIGGIYHENPFFVAPEQMMKEIEARNQANRE